MHTRIFAIALLLGAGCSAPPSGATRLVTGRLRVSTAGMSKPVVVAESSDRRVFVANVTAGGRFALTLPPDGNYRLTLASSLSRAGRYSAVARINWPLADGAARWAHLGGGGALDLGNVHRRGTRPSGTVGAQCDGCGDTANGGDGGMSDGATCKEDDGASTTTHDSDYDCDCDHAAADGDHCDRDDDADDHEQACDDGDDDKSGDYDHDDDDDGDEHDHDGHACDGGTTTPTPPPAAPDMSPVP